MLRLFHKTADQLVGIFFAAFLVLVAFATANAANVTAASDTLSRLKVGTATNHTIVFVTPSGVSEGATMTVTFPASFGASGLTEDDVDLLDNGLSVSTAANCSGVEQAAAVWTGNTLSFQICPGDGGAFAPGSTVMIRIGTNAVDFGVGVNRLINPPTTGTYRAVIGGSFGDSGTIPISVTTDDQIGVTACVGASCTALPPPPPPPVTPPITGGSTGPEQTPPPQISNLVIDQITAGTARVSWQTDVVSDSHALYGLTPSLGAISGNSNLTLNHQITLIGLGSNLTYHLVARSMGSFGDIGLSDDRTFTTLPVQNEAVLQIRDIRLESISGDEAIISWSTNAPAVWRVEFGRTSNYGNVIEGYEYADTQQTTLGNLSPATDYHFRIIAVDKNGNQAVSPDQAFTTFDTIPPAISNIRVEFIAPHSADIAWDTNKPATGGVKYGEAPSYEKGEVLESLGFSTQHRITLNNLLDGTIYHYQIFQTDRSGNDMQSGDRSFLTTNQLTLPVPAENAVPIEIPKNAIAIGSGKILLTVNNVPSEIVANVAIATPGSIVGLGLPKELLAKPIASIVVQVGGLAYHSKGSWVYFNTPTTPGEYSLLLYITYTDGSSAYSKFILNVVPPGSIYELKNGLEIPVPDVLVTVLEDCSPWDGSKYGQNNFVITDTNGNYSFFLPKAKYSLKIEKEGYDTTVTEVKHYTGPVTDSVEIHRTVVVEPNLRSIAIIIAKYSISHPLCSFPWLLLIIIACYIAYRFYKRKFILNKQKNIK